MAELTLLWFPDGKADHQPSHDVADFEIFLRAAGMGVVTFDAGRGDGNIGVDRFEYLFCAAFDGAGIGSGGPRLNFLQTTPLEFSFRRIGLVDRPLTDQTIADVRTGQFGNFTRLLHELYRQGQGMRGLPVF